MRERRTALFPIALSPARLADVLGIRPELIADAIKNDLLPCYRKGLNREAGPKMSSELVTNIPWISTRRAANLAIFHRI